MPNQKIDSTTCKYADPVRGDVNGGTFGAVSPVLKGQYSNEIIAGLQYDVGYDLVLGAAYQHRDLGRIIEDMSPDGGQNYIVANPGEPTDPATVKDLQGKIAKENDAVKKAALQSQLALYQGVQSFEPPKREFNALVLQANKRLSHNFLLNASYTYSRTIGNYPGLFQASNGQLDPNISTQYDLRELLVNRNGPLPNDRPHIGKVAGAYFIPFGRSSIILGANFNLQSGVPIEVLGRHPTYGRQETFILPRGSGGRTPMLTTVDVSAHFRQQVSKLMALEFYWDVFNALNQHEVTAVDNEYALNRVAPIANGTVADLTHLKSTDGTAVNLNANYGRATAYQAPLSMRFGIRASF